MTVCTDVYVRPQTCDLIEIYPSQVHPGRGGGVTGGIKISESKGRGELRRDDLKLVLTDDDVAIATALLELLD